MSSPSTSRTTSRAAACAARNNRSMRSSVLPRNSRTPHRAAASTRESSCGRSVVQMITLLRTIWPQANTCTISRSSAGTPAMSCSALFGSLLESSRIGISAPIRSTLSLQAALEFRSIRIVASASALQAAIVLAKHRLDYAALKGPFDGRPGCEQSPDLPHARPQGLETLLDLPLTMHGRDRDPRNAYTMGDQLLLKTRVQL